MLGALAAAEALTGHAAQVGIPSLPDLTLRIDTELDALFARIEPGVDA